VTPDRLRLSLRAMLRALVVPACVAALLLAPAVAWAGKPAARHKPAAHAATRKAPPASTAKERTPSPAATESRSTTTSTTSASDDSGGDDSSGGDAPAAAEVKAGGKKVTSKTYTFGAMDVEGKLKTPQLLYFLNRVKLELDMSAPDKRSFMKELQQSADDKNL
jgi:cytoskeletal protein RodZ